jgi:hypothetical protein
MSTTRWLILLFWVVVIGGLIKGAYDFDSNLQSKATAHPTPDETFFTPLPGQAPAPAAPVAPVEGADVQQVDFNIQDDTPSVGSFTCQVTVKNLGNEKAENVQIHVLPFKGGRSGSDDVGHHPLKPLSDGDSLAQTGNWLAFPDLAPGESSTQSITFLSHEMVEPGRNANPEIQFTSAKAKP